MANCWYVLLAVPVYLYFQYELHSSLLQIDIYSDGQAALGLVSMLLIQGCMIILLLIAVTITLIILGSKHLLPQRKPELFLLLATTTFILVYDQGYLKLILILDNLFP